jgi:hypothetical protein
LYSDAVVVLLVACSIVGKSGYLRDATMRESESPVCPVKYLLVREPELSAQAC